MLAVLVSLLQGSGTPAVVALGASSLDQLCGYAYPSFTRFVVEDGGQDDAAYPLRFCSAYQQFGGERSLGLPISRPFRVGPDLYQALEYGMLHWRADRHDTVLLNVMDLLHAAGRDPALEHLGIPPGQAPSSAWLTDDLLNAVYAADRSQYGLPTSPPVDRGSYVVQRYQRGILRRWLVPPPYELAGSWTGSEMGSASAERLRVGALLRTMDLIPAAALVVDPGWDPQRYNWSEAPAVPTSFWSNASQPVGGWAMLAGRAGAFDVGTAGQDVAAMQAEVAQAADLGLRLAVNGYVGRDSPVEQSALDRDLSLVDTYPWGRIETACGASIQEQACKLDSDQLDTIERQVRHHLQVTRKDDSVVAYWVLDDFPGDVRPALELIHRLVQEDALTGRSVRPTVCGFGGNLDNAHQSLATSRATFDAAVTNFTLLGCDAVALYPYAHVAGSDQDGSVDWSMADLLPYMLARLRERGWDPNQQPLIGIPQAFQVADGAVPTATSVAAQSAAYCAGGASTILFYAWNDNFTGDKSQLFNAPSLRSGATSGLEACRAIWSAAPTTPAGMTTTSVLSQKFVERNGRCWTGCRRPS
jgi:hypothetical protein